MRSMCTQTSRVPSESACSGCIVSESRWIEREERTERRVGACVCMRAWLRMCTLMENDGGASREREDAARCVSEMGQRTYRSCRGVRRIYSAISSAAIFTHTLSSVTPRPASVTKGVVSDNNADPAGAPGPRRRLGRLREPYGRMGEQWELLRRRTARGHQARA